MAATSRGQAMREARRTAQFAKFRLVNLNLIPLVDTFVSIVFFALTTQTLGDVAPITPGVTLPASVQRTPAAHELTLGIGSNPAQVTLSGNPVMTVREAASARSDVPSSPLIIPQLYAALRQAADSVRRIEGTPSDQSVKATLAIQGDRTMKYDLLARVMQTARYAGFKNLSLQVLRNQGGTAATPVRST